MHGLNLGFPPVPSLDIDYPLSGSGAARREGDLLGLTWEPFDGERPVLKQGTAGRDIVCFLSPETVALSEECRKGMSTHGTDHQRSPRQEILERPFITLMQ